MSTDLETDILIVGGGMVGLTLAAALAEGGIRSVVVDRANPTDILNASFDGRVTALADSSCRLMKAINVWPGLEDQAQPINQIRVSDGSSPLFLHFGDAQLGDGPMGHLVENRIIREALYSRISDEPLVEFLTETLVTAFERNGHVDASLSDGRKLRAAAIIGSEGRNSPTRKAAGIRTIGWAYNQTGIVATVRHEKPHHGIAQEHFLPSGPFAMLPMVGNRSSLVWTERPDIAAALLKLDNEKLDWEMRQRFGDFLGDVHLDGPKWSYPLSLQRAEKFTDHRLALIGDAAHGIHPISGQGLNLGLRDAATLAEAMVDAARLGLDMGSMDVLSRYESWRRFDTELTLLITDSLNRLFSNDIAPVRHARDLGLAVVNRMPWLKSLFMRHAKGHLGDLPRLLEGKRI